MHLKFKTSKVMVAGYEKNIGNVQAQYVFKIKDLELNSYVAIHFK